MDVSVESVAKSKVARVKRGRSLGGVDVGIMTGYGVKGWRVIYWREYLQLKCSGAYW